MISQLFEVELRATGKKETWKTLVRTYARFPKLFIRNAAYQLDKSRFFAPLCSRLVELEFKNMTLNSADFISTLQHCVSLKELALDTVSLRDGRSQKLNELLKDPSRFLGWLPALTVLRLRLYTFFDFQGPNNPNMNLLQCLANVGRNGRFEKLSVVDGNYTEPDGAISSTLAELIEGGPPAPSHCAPIKQIIDSNRETLRTITTVWEKFASSGADPSPLDLELGLIRNSDPGNTKLSLDRFKGRSDFLQFGEPDPILHPWRGVLLHQEHLKELILNFDRLSFGFFEGDEDDGPAISAIENFVAEIIGKNVGTLAALSVTSDGLGGAQEFTWDFHGLLSRCCRLKSIELFFKEDLNFMGRATVPKFSGT
jgi:hypothetical protein